jgi:hypothetical protein
MRALHHHKSTGPLARRVLAAIFGLCVLTYLAATMPAAAQARAGSLEAAITHIAATAAATKGPVLAASVAQEGHWTFANGAGERFTAATPDELKRALTTLVPETSTSPPLNQLTLLLTEDTVFNAQARLKDLPKGAALSVVVDGNVLPLRVRGDSATAQLYAEVRPNLLVMLTSRARFDEAVWQLNRPLKSAHVRVLGLQPGGPATLSRSPRLDTTTQRPLLDQLDPLRAADALKSIPGQTAVIVGRVEGKLLFVRGSSGPEQSVIISDLVQAANDADVNLILLQSASARQPGTRNWLWQTAEVSGLDAAVARAQLSDFLNVLGTGDRPLAISTPDGTLTGGRITLEIAPVAPPAPLGGLLPPGLAPARATDAINGAIGSVMSGVTGQLAVSAATLHLQSRARASMLAGRWVRSVPIGWLEVYVGGLLLGLLGWRWTAPWWQRLWPREAATDYRSAFGYGAALAVRAMVMVAVFMPLAGLALLPVLLVRPLFGLKSPPGTATTAQTGTRHPSGPAT